MAITGISALSGQQIIASGACSARSAATASYTTGGNDIQGLYTTVNSNSAAWAAGTTYTGDAQGALDEVYSKSGDWNTVTSKQAAGDYYSASNPSGFITGVDLSDYATTAELVDKQDITGMTAYQPVGSYLTADALDNVSANWNEVSAKLDTTAFSDVSGTFLTAHQDISNKLDTTAFSDVSGSFLTGIPDTYLQNTDLSTTDGKVTAISGIPLSAGGATNFIAGNGITIDSPSAGTVRIGNDETVLWSGAMASAANLSEPMTAFDYVKVYYADDFTDTERYHTVAQLDPNNGAHMWQPVGGLGEAGCWIGITYMSANNDYTTITVPKVKLIKFGTWAATATGANAITTVTTGENVAVLYKVIGVSHISGGNA